MGVRLELVRVSESVRQQSHSPLDREWPVAVGPPLRVEEEALFQNI
jgi:hypothetical protein